MKKLLTSLVVGLAALASCGASGDYCPIVRPQLTSIRLVKKEQRPGLLKAINGWNRLLKKNYFQLSEYAPTLIIGSHKIPKELNFLAFYEPPDLIVLDESIPPQYVTKVAYHELGHSMGLPHNADVNSIMYPAASEMRAEEPNELDAMAANYYINKNVNKTDPLTTSP